MTTSRVVRGGKVRRAVEWFDTIFDQTLPVSTNTVIVLSNGIVDDEKKGMTLIRTLVDLKFTPTTADTATRLSVGFFFIEADALAAPALPDPATADEQPGWFYRWAHVCNIDSTSVSRDRAVADIKAMRKFRAEDYDIVMVAETGAGAPIAVSGLIRLLVKKA